MTDDEVACGLDGNESDPVQIGRFNRWIARVMRSHMIPMKNDLNLLTAFVEEAKIERAKIQGGIKVLLWMVPAANAILLMVIYLLWASGVISS